MDHADDGGANDDVFIYMGGSVPQHLRETITHVCVHKSVKIITARAFEYCKHLVSVKMHDGVEIIGKEAFEGCSSLKGISLSGVRVIEEWAFHNCRALKIVEFGNKLEIIGEGVFYECASVRNIKLPKIKVIGKYAFSECEQLTEVELSEDLERIEEKAFMNCRRLLRITLPMQDNLLDNDVFNYCHDLSTVDLVGGVHKTISSLLLDSWRNEMKDEIGSINRDLPNTDSFDKTYPIRRWMERVFERIEHYKSRRDSDDGVMEETTMDGASVDQSEESNQQDVPKEQAAVHDETDKSASSAGVGPNLEDEVPETKEIKGMAVEIKDDSSFGGGDQNGDLHTESDVSSEEGRQSDFVQSTKGSEEESEIQRLKAHLKKSESKNAAMEARLKQNEEDKNQQRQEYERKVAGLEEENGHLKEETVRLKKKLKVSVQSNADFLEAAFKESMKIVHEPEVIRQLAEEGLMKCSRNHKVKVGRSTVDPDGVGAIAIAKISAGEKIFRFNGAPSNETISLTKDKIAKLPPHVQRVVRMYTIPDNDGVRDVPKNGFSFALGISWYLNSAKDTDFEANVELGPNLDESGFAELIALRDIEAGEELLDSYELGDTL